MGYGYRKSKSYNNYHLIFNIIIPVSVLVIVGLVLYYVIFADTLLKYTVKFYDGDTLHASVESSENEEIDLPTPPSANCRVFEGWYYDNNTWKKPFSSTDFVEFPIDKDYKVYAKWSDFKHTPGEWDVVTDATCTSEGLKTLSCSVCKSIVESQKIEIKSHKASSPKKENIVSPTCVSEGSYVEVVYCSACNYKMSEVKKSVAIDPYAHCFDKDYAGNRIYPAVDGNYSSFCFEGVCSLCSKNAFEKNISLDVKYDYDCLTGGKAIYTYYICGTKFTYDDHLIPAGEHVLNGVPATFWSIDTEYVDTVSYNVYSSTLDGIKISVDQDVVCGARLNGIYQCESCGKYPKIKVDVPHQGEWKVSESPSCVSTGERSIYCSICKLTITETIGNHEFIYTVTDEKNIVGVDSKTEYQFVNLVGKCISGDCPDVDIVENVVYKYKVTPTCVDRGSVSYSLASVPGEKFLSVAANTSHHIYNDFLNKVVYASEVQNPDGSFDSVFSDLILFGDSSDKCGEIGKGYFECRHCKKNVIVDIFNVHKGEWTDVEGNAPNCVGYGQQVRVCEDCDNKEYRSIAPLGHEYEYELVLVKSSPMTFNVLKSCSRADLCGFIPENALSKNITSGFKSTVVDKETCGRKGYTIYTYKFVSADQVEYELSYDHYFTTTSVSGKHKLSNGTVFSNYYITVDGVKYLDYEKANKYVTFFSDSVECCVPTEAYFECKTCKKPIIVEVYKKHKGTFETVKEPTCYENGGEGLKTMDCAYCGEVEEVLPKLAHTYNCELTPKPEGDTYTFILSAECTVEGCGYLRDDEIIFASDKNLKKKVIKSTCVTEGRTRYTYSATVNDEVFNASCEVDFKPKIEHKLCGKEFSHNLDANGYLPSNLKGVILHEDVDESKVKNGDIVIGGYTCEECDGFVEGIEVKIVK